MPLTNKAGWLEALRSGRYRQGLFALRSRDHTFCCLGVYCEVLGIPSRYDVNSGEYCYPIKRYGDGLEEREETSLQCPAGFGGLTDDECKILAEMNDRNHSFTKIADWIEANLEG